MSEEIEQKLLRQIKQLQKEMRELKSVEGVNTQEQNQIPSFSFSKIKDSDLKKLVKLDFNLDKTIFNNWFNSEIKISKEIINFLEKLLNKTADLIPYYDEEDLKVHFLTPLFLHIDFTSFKKKFRDFYHEQITYKTDKFIFNGKVDFVLAKGLIESEKPYFFIQEFKKGQEFSNPRPQLLAELIAGLELSNFSEIKGAFIVGINWNFVILEKLGKDKYQYFISHTFNSTNFEDLKNIFKNLLFIKNKMIKEVKND
jgi:hypothetical protein